MQSLLLLLGEITILSQPDYISYCNDWDLGVYFLLFTFWHLLLAFEFLLFIFAKLSPSPSSNWAVAGFIPSFSVRQASRPAGRPPIQNSTFW